MEAFNHRIKIEHWPTHIHCVMEGSLLMALAQDMTLFVLKFARHFGINKILMDCRNVEGHISMGERFNFIQFLSQQPQGIEVNGVSRRMHMAYVVKRGAGDPTGFGSMVAANRGVSLNVTTSVEAAAEWLEVPTEMSGATH